MGLKSTRKPAFFQLSSEWVLGTLFVFLSGSNVLKSFLFNFLPPHMHIFYVFGSIFEKTANFKMQKADWWCEDFKLNVKGEDTCQMFTKVNSLIMYTQTLNLFFFYIFIMQILFNEPKATTAYLLSGMKRIDFYSFL